MKSSSGVDLGVMESKCLAEEVWSKEHLSILTYELCIQVLIQRGRKRQKSSETLKYTENVIECLHAGIDVFTQERGPSLSPPPPLPFAPTLSVFHWLIH